MGYVGQLCLSHYYAYGFIAESFMCACSVSANNTTTLSLFAIIFPPGQYFCIWPYDFVIKKNNRRHFHKFLKKKKLLDFVGNERNYFRKTM